MSEHHQPICYKENDQVIFIVYVYGMGVQYQPKDAICLVIQSLGTHKSPDQLTLGILVKFLSPLGPSVPPENPAQDSLSSLQCLVINLSFYFGQLQSGASERAVTLGSRL